MRRILFSAILFLMPFLLQAQLIELPKIKVPGLKWETAYQFDKVNRLKVDYYDKKGRLKQSHDYEIYYQQSGKSFYVCKKISGY